MIRIDLNGSSVVLDCFVDAAELFQGTAEIEVSVCELRVEF